MKLYENSDPSQQYLSINSGRGDSLHTRSPVVTWTLHKWKVAVEDKGYVRTNSLSGIILNKRTRRRHQINLNSLPSDRTLGKANLNRCSVQMIGIRCADCWSYVCLLKKEVDQAFMANTTHPCSFMANTTHPCSRRIKRRTFTGLKNKTNQIPLITYLYSTTTSLTEHWCGVSCYKAFAFTWILLCLSLQLQASFCLQLHKVCDT